MTAQPADPASEPGGTAISAGVATKLAELDPLDTTIDPDLARTLEALDDALRGLTGKRRRRAASSVFFDVETGELRTRNLTAVPRPD